MSSVEVKRAVENIRSGTTAYTPLIELIVNAIQAIRMVRERGGRVSVTIIRSEQTEALDKIPNVDGFTVEDDGIGFTKEHRDSFDTLYTSTKAADGGKGFGRFTCLKYFQNVSVESIFSEGGKKFRRVFEMGKGKNIIVGEKISPANDVEVGSKITVKGYIAGRGARFPDKSLEVIARIVVEKLLPYFINPKYSCPQIIIRERGDQDGLILNDYLAQENRQIEEMPVSDAIIARSSADGSEQFLVRVFKLFFPRSARSKISLVAHSREVTDVTIQTYIPEFSDEFFERADEEAGEAIDRNYIIKAYVFGDYLDKHVALERGAFNFHRDEELILGISQTDIERAAAAIARNAVGAEITVRRERKIAHIHSYIEREAPWHRNIAAEVNFDALPMRPSAEEIELHLQKAKLEMENFARARVREILAGNDSSDTLDQKVSEVVRSISQTSKNDLIHYVSTRKCVLDLFGRALEANEEGKFRSEGDVHDIIMPRRRDSDTINYDQHNLWILDERLNFAGYISSDKASDGVRGDRTDLTVFGHRIAFRGDNEKSNPIIIFEFKKPQRHDFANPSSNEDPVQQIVRYVNAIRDGKFKLPNGREILVTDNTPFYGYVVCDLPKKVRIWLEREKNFTEMPDGLGYFNWYDKIRLYIEVLSWDKVKLDAEMRNKIFFKTLGI